MENYALGVKKHALGVKKHALGVKKYALGVKHHALGVKNHGVKHNHFEKPRFDGKPRPGCEKTRPGCETPPCPLHGLLKKTRCVGVRKRYSKAAFEQAACLWTDSHP